MADRPITRFVDVQITKSSPSVSQAGFGVLLIMTDSLALTRGRRVESFTSVAAVEDFFGATSQEAYAADAFFEQDPFSTSQPEELLFGKRATVDEAAYLETGDATEQDLDVWKLVTDGTFEISANATVYDVTACDFSAATSLTDVASVINTQLAAASPSAFPGTVAYQDNRFVFSSTATGSGNDLSLLAAQGTGTDISGVDTATSDYLNGAVLKSTLNPGGAILTTGYTTGDETIEEAITAMEAANSDWYGISFVQSFRGSAELEDVADSIEGRRKMFFAFADDAGYLTGSSSTLAAYCNNLNYKRTVVVYYDDDSAADAGVRYPAISWVGQQFPKEIGQSNWAYKELAGIAEGARVDITPLDLTETEKDNVLSVFANTYTTTLGASYMYFGTACGGRDVDKNGEYIDIVRNIDFLQARIEEGILSLLVETEIVPFTDGGISTVDNRLRSLLDTYGVKQKILVEGSVQTSFPSRSQTSSTDRDDRLLPDGKFQVELQGAIDKVIVRGTVYI